MVQENSDQSFTSGEIHFESDSQFREFWKLRSNAFSAWYGHMRDDFPTCLRDRKSVRLGRLRFNAKAACFPEVFRQIKDASGEVCGYLQMTPAYWGGDAGALNNLEYYDRWHDFKRLELFTVMFAYLVGKHLFNANRLFQRLVKPVREAKYRRCNTIILTAMFIDDRHRGQRIPSRLITSAKEQLEQLKFEYLISPFRPSEYGKYKLQNGLQHSSDNFKSYCYSENNEGYPADAWLRALVKNGMKMLKPEPRSFCVQHSLECFEAFTSLHKPDAWYQSATDVWECGETQTWYVDRGNDTAYSIEPNMWGQLVP